MFSTAPLHKSNDKANNTNSLIKKNRESSFIQPKLNVGKPGDKYENEADAAADQIIAKSNNESSFTGGEPFFPPTTKPSIQKVSGKDIQQQEVQEETEQIQEKPLAETLTPVVQLKEEEEVQQKEEQQENDVQLKEDTQNNLQSKENQTTPPSITPTVQKEEEEIQEKEEEEPVQTMTEKKVQTSSEEQPVQAMEEETTLQQKTAKNIQMSGDGNNTSSIENNLSSSKGGGNPLPNNTKNKMESGFGADFSGVRIHNDSNAVQMNQQLGAQAFTNGNDIYFNDGKYDPKSDSGKHLLAHELTHTIQQGASTGNVQKNEIQDAASQNNKTNPNAPSDPYFTPVKREENQSPSQFQQKNKSDVKNQLTKETNKAASESPVKAKIEEGKPTELVAEKEENPADKTIELDTANEQQPGLEKSEDTSQNKKNPTEKGKKKGKKKGKEKKEASNLSQQPIAETTQLPGIPEDSGVQAMRDQTNQPSQADIEEQQNDTRTDEEKIAIQSQLSSQFQAQHQSSITTIQNKIAQETNKLRIQEQTISDSIRVEAQLKSNQIRTTIAAKKAELQVAYQQGQATLLVNKQTDLARLEQIKASKLEILATEMETRRTSFNTFVDEQTNMPTVNANNEADRAERELEAAAVQALADGENVARQHPGSDDGNPDAREAIREIARETASDIRGSKQTIREDLVNLASEFNGGFEAYRTDISNQLDSTKEELTTGINNAAAKFVGIIEQSYSSISQTLTQKEQEDLQKLDQLQTEKLEALENSKNLGLDKAKQITEQSINEIERSGQYITELIENLGNNVSEQLAPSGEHIPLISAMQEFHQSSLSQLQGLEQDGIQQLDTISNQGNEALSNTQTANNQIGASIIDATLQKATDILTSSTSQREQVLNEHATTVETSFTSFETSLDQMRTEALAGVDDAIEDRKGKMLQANAEFLTELISQNNENIQTAKQPLTDPLVSRLWSAADRATASWWEGMLAAIGDLVVMLVIIVAIAAILVAFGVFSTITGALMVIGAVLLAGMFIYSLYTRLSEGHGWSSILLAASDTLGITMIYQGVTNTDIATGRDLGLNTFDRWHQGTTGTLQFLLIISPLKSRIPGIRSIRIPRAFGRIPGVRGIGRGIGRFVKWIEGVGRNTRIRRGGGTEVPSYATQAGRWLANTRIGKWIGNKWKSFRTRNEEPVPENESPKNPKKNNQEESGYQRRIGSLKSSILNRISQLRNRINGIQEQLTDIHNSTNRQLPNDAPNRTPVLEANRRTRAQVEETRQGLNNQTERLNNLERQANEATSERQLNRIEEQLDQVNGEIERIGQMPMTGRLGIRQETAEAIETLETLKHDPLGDINSEANKNHYNAARIEARNEIIQKDGQPVLREDGSPYSHIRDLQNARDALVNVKRQLQIEQQDPLPTITERGMDVIIQRMSEIQRLLSRLDGFLHQIGWPASRPHRWIQRPDGTWVGEGDIAVIGPRTGQRVDTSITRVTNLRDRIARIPDRDTANGLLQRRTALLEEYQNLRQRINQAETEVEVQGMQTELEQLDIQSKQLERDIHSSQ